MNLIKTQSPSDSVVLFSSTIFFLSNCEFYIHLTLAKLLN